jgi:hypothetical protein
VSGRPSHEVAEVFRRLRDSAIPAPAPKPEQRRVVHRILRCRTAALGGHVDACSDCGHREISYNSCRDRHCPKCQGSAQADWLQQRQADVLPVPYGHVVFTLPHELGPLALAHPRVLYDLLFRAAASTLLDVAANPRFLGARIGFFSVLHTWGQTLVHHPHLHCVVPAGGLAADGSTWVACPRGFFLPVRVLSRLFRARYLDGLRDAHGQGLLGQMSHAALEDLVARCLQKPWVVFAKPPFDGPDSVLTYLARYTHRVAISNHRLVSLDDQRVRFRFKDYRGRRVRHQELPLAEFARRFLLHVLPRRFVRIRYYGLLAHGCRRRMLSQCRLALQGHAEASPSEPAPPPDSLSVLQNLLPVPPRLCPACKKAMLACVEVLERPPPFLRSFRGLP